MKRICIFIIAILCVCVLLYAGMKQDTPEIFPEMDLVNYSSVSEEAIREFLWENIPELSSYAEHIGQESEGEACLYIEIQEAVEVDMETLAAESKFFPVYVGEKWETHTANWDWFYVSEDMSVIYWENIVEGEYYSLEDWRRMDEYRDL